MHILASENLGMTQPQLNHKSTLGGVPLPPPTSATKPMVPIIDSAEWAKLIHDAQATLKGGGKRIISSSELQVNQKMVARRVREGGFFF